MTVLERQLYLTSLPFQRLSRKPFDPRMDCLNLFNEVSLHKHIENLEKLDEGFSDIQETTKNR